MRRRARSFSLSVRATGLGAGAGMPSIADIRALARVMPGARPQRVNILKFAESRRTKNFSVKGAPTEPSVQARTAFQVVYPDGTLMVDAGMDLQVHRFFGRGVEEPYFPDVAKEVEQAVADARLDRRHARARRSRRRRHPRRARAELARKTVLTRTQVQTLQDAPQMPEIKLTPETGRALHRRRLRQVPARGARHRPDQGGRPHARLADGLHRAGVGARAAAHRRRDVAHGRRAPDARQGGAVDHRGSAAPWTRSSRGSTASRAPSRTSSSWRATTTSSTPSC